ncbi:MAG: hypothetical protein M3Z92_00305 [Bacteroidota bacterium]|nr:hypothetical protein [Bacteroidota bacterium]
MTNDENIRSHSTIHKNADTFVIKKEIKIADTSALKINKDSAKKQIYFAAGLALHQLLPVNGQKLVTYNSLGRRGTLTDYIPSIYFRMYKDKKWFVQSELRYGAPQNTKEVIYKQQKFVDTSSNTTKTTSAILKKTYYHQLPISFNHFTLPGFTAGVGLTWNKFSSAVIDHEVKVTNNITQIDSIKVNQILHSQKRTVIS